MSERILIVDDDECVYMNLCAYLEDEGYSVHAAGSGEDALSYLRMHSPDFAIVDMRLPSMDGNEFIYHAHTIRPGLQFLIHTGSVEYEIPEILINIHQVRRQIFYKPVINMGLLVQEIQSAAY